MTAVTPDRVVWIGHATVLIELGGARVITDPVLRPRLAHLRRTGTVTAVGAAPLDAVLLSHLHRDHADGPSLRRLPAGTRVFVPEGAAPTVRRLGIDRVTEVRTGESVEVATGVSARAVPAVHDGRRGPLGHGAEAIGWVIEAQRRVYFAGDTDVFDGMREFAAGVDLALLPISGWGPTMGPGHMGPPQAAEAVALLAPRVAVPIHWGTFLPIGMARRRPDLLSAPGPAFAALCERAAPGTSVVVLAPGESLELVSDPAASPGRQAPPPAATGTAEPL